MRSFSEITADFLKPGLYIKLYIAYVSCYIIRDAIIVKFPNDWA